MSSPLQPSMRLLVTLGSIALYAKKLHNAQLTVDEQVSYAALLKDPELETWLEQMDRLAFMPVKR